MMVELAVQIIQGRIRGMYIFLILRILPLFLV